jgi:hypothetical protein
MIVYEHEEIVHDVANGVERLMDRDGGDGNDGREGWIYVFIW